MILLSIAIGTLVMPRAANRKVQAGFITVLFLVVGLQAYAGHKAFIATPIQSRLAYGAEFCDWQRVWAPILSPELYQGDSCWSIYQAGREGAPRNRP